MGKIQPDEHHLLRLRVQALQLRLALGGMLGDMTENHAFVCKALVLECLVVCIVYREQQIPDGDERLVVFLGKVPVLSLETAHQGTDGIVLRLACELLRIHGNVLVIRDILQDPPRVRKILVDISEVAQYHATPEQEIIKRLRGLPRSGFDLRVNVIKFHQQSKFIRKGTLLRIKRPEEV